MAGIPSKCPKCGRTKAWKEEVNAFKSGIPVGGGLFRIRLGMGPGLLSGPIRRALGCYKVTYRCRNCGFRGEYPTGE